MANEKQFEHKVRKFLDEKGAYNIKYFGCAMTSAGVPDLLVCFKGIFFGIELKAEDGKPSELQLLNLRKINKAGGVGVLLYPKDFERFKTLLNQFENNPQKFMELWAK